MKQPQRIPLPSWLKTKVRKGHEQLAMRNLLKDSGIHTVCESARCPNRGECFGNKTLTFMILGTTCTRNCRFCAVDKGIPASVDQDEPKRIVQAVMKLGLSYVVITSVTRDDLPDGGAGHFRVVVDHLKRSLPAIRTEILTPDFGGDMQALDTVLTANPTVFNHNIETVRRLYPEVRPQADYNRSLLVLSHCKQKYPGILTKSGLMAGLGEAPDEVEAALRDLADHGVDIVTIGQYLQPSPRQLPVNEYISPAIFQHYDAIGKKLGLRIMSGPFVRSSYRALEVCSDAE